VVGKGERGNRVRSDVRLSWKRRQRVGDERDVRAQRKAGISVAEELSAALSHPLPGNLERAV
jgi:hypothetical protein